MKSKKTSRLNELLDEVENLLRLDSPEEKTTFYAVAIQLDILNEVQKIMTTKNMSRKTLAEKLGKSKSFISQLFSGDKNLNLKMIAEFQNIFNVKFESRFKANTSISKSKFTLKDYKKIKDDKQKEFDPVKIYPIFDQKAA